MKKILRIMAVLIGILIVSSPFVWAEEEYPSRPITLLCGMAPGGILDLQVRILADMGSKVLGKPIVVNNMPGANAALMMDFLSRQKPDGYTLGAGGGSYMIMNPLIAKVNYSYKDFTYIHSYCLHPMNISVRKDAPWKTFKDFVEYSKKNPGKVKYATWAPTSPITLQMRMIAKLANVDWIHIPYKGDSQVITAVLGGHADAAGTSATIVPYAKAGTMRLLTVFLKNRWKEFPDVPSVWDFGYDIIPLTDWTSITGVFGPKGLTGAPMAKLEAAFAKVMKDPAFEKQMEKFYVPLMILGSKEYSKAIAEAWAKCEKVLPPIIKEVQKE